MLGCPEPNDAPSGDGTGNHPCETAPPQATSGGDHGTPWGFDPADDTSAMMLDVGVLPPEDDPEDWEYEASADLYYRSPTDQEMTDYGWDAATLLVVLDSALVRRLTGSVASATIKIPIHDLAQSRPQEGLDLATVGITRQWTTNVVPHRKVSYNGTTTTRTTIYPTYSFYLPSSISWSALPDRVVAVMASDQGGLSIAGGTKYEQVYMRGPYADGSAWYDLEIAPPVGTTFFVLHTAHEAWLLGQRALGTTDGRIAVAPLARAPHSSSGLASGTAPDATLTLDAQCDDALDNDPDGRADNCDENCIPHNDYGAHLRNHTSIFEYTKDFALYGDLLFCSETEPTAELMMVAATGINIFNNVDPPSEYTPTPRAPPLRMTMTACFDVVTPAQADACDNDIGTCVIAGYPLLGTEDSYSDKRAKVWDVVNFMVGGDSSANVHPVHLAGLITARIEAGEGGVGWTYAANTPGENGSFVVRANKPPFSRAGMTLAHEVGHTMGLAHEEGSDAVLYPGTTVRGFMTPGDGAAPVLNWTMTSDLGFFTQGQVWRDQVPAKAHPRANGFKWTNCNAGGHPGCAAGLTCNTDGTCE